MSDHEFSLEDLDLWEGPEEESITETEKRNDIKLIEAYGLNTEVDIEEIEEELTQEDVLTARRKARKNCLYRGDLTLYEWELAVILLYEKYLPNQ